MPRKKDPRPQYADRLLDHLLERFQLKNDAALCRMLGVSPPHLSKVRHKTLQVSPGLLMTIYDATKIGIEDLLALLYDPA